MIACSITAQAQNTWTLRQCIDHAIEHNIQIRQTENQAQQSKVNVNTAKWARLPNLNGSINQNWNWGRNASPIDNTYSDINNANTGLSIGTNIPVFTGLQIPNQYALSKLNLKAAIEDLNKAKEDIAIYVTSGYLQVLLNLELSKIAQKQIELSHEQLHRIQELYKAGKASPSEVAEVQARMAQDEMNAVQADNNYKLALLDLSQQLELPTPEDFILADPQDLLKFSPLTPPEDIYTQAMLYKPGIKAAEYRLQGMEKNIRIAQSYYYPQLSFTAGLGTSYYTINGKSEQGFGNQLKNNFNKYLGFNLSVPIFNRFSTRNRVHTARLQKINQELQLDDVKKKLYKEIQQAWYNALASESKYKSSEAAVKANEASFQLINERFNNGKATSLEYNESKLSLTKALSDRTQAKYDYLFRIKILEFYKGQTIE